MKRTGIRNKLGEKGHHKYYMDNKVNLLGIKTEAEEKHQQQQNKLNVQKHVPKLSILL